MLFLSFILLIPCQMFFSTSMSSEDALILYTNETPSALLTSLKSYSKRYKILSQNSSEIIEHLSPYNFFLLLDLTSQPSLLPILDTVAAFFNVYYFSSLPPSYASNSNLFISPHCSYEQEALSLNRVIDQFEWKEYLLLSSSNRQDLDIADILYETTKERVSNYLKYESELSQEYFDNFVGKMIKVVGVYQILVVDSTEGLTKIQAGLRNKNLLKVGTSLVISSRGVYNADFQGAIVLVEAGLQSSCDKYEYEAKAIENAVSNAEVTSIPTFILANQSSCSEYLLLNLQNSSKKIVGRVSPGFIELNDSIIYPGGVAQIPKTGSTQLTVSIANGTNDPFFVYPMFAYVYTGALYAVARSNYLQEIPKFTLSLFPTDCGIYNYVDKYYQDCYSKIKDKLGIVYLSSFWHTSTYWGIITLRSLGIEIPEISPFSQDDLVDNRTELPELVKLSLPNSDFYSSIFPFQVAFGWNAIVLFATDGELQIQQYNDIIKYSAMFNIKAVNPEDKRIFRESYKHDTDFEEYRSYFQAAKDTNCRVYYIQCAFRIEFWKSLYAIGFRSGDIILIGDFFTITYLQQEASNANLTEVGELLEGSFQFNYKEYNGELGQQVMEYMLPLSTSIPGLCLAYDTVTVAKEAIKYVLAKGEDYENAATMTNAIRSIKTTGCLGSIHFNAYSNSRSAASVGFSQVRFNKTIQDWSITEVVYVDKMSSMVINVVNDIIWAEGFTTAPSNFRDPNPCPFDSYQKKTSFSGRNLLYIVCAAFMIFALLAAVCSHSEFKRDIEKLNQNSIISLPDKFFFSFFVFEWLQLLSMGPDQLTFRKFLKDIGYLLSLEISMYFTFEFDNFWYFFYVILALISMWTVLCLIFIFKFIDICENWCVCKQVKTLGELLLPILGHIGFLPLFSMSLNVFMCVNGIGDDLTQSYFEPDCRCFCYTAKHEIFVVITSVSLLFYVPTAVYCRPFWEKMQPTLHISTKPLYLSILSIFQVTVCILNKVLKLEQQSIHGVTLVLLITLMIVITFYMEPYSYDRANVLQITFLLMSNWGVLSAVIFTNTGNINVWMGVETAGFVVIAAVGFVFFRRKKNYLDAEKGTSVAKLIVEQFNRCYNKVMPYQEYFDGQERGLEYVVGPEDNELK